LAVPSWGKRIKGEAGDAGFDAGEPAFDSHSEIDLGCGISEETEESANMPRPTPGKGGGGGRSSGTGGGAGGALGAGGAGFTTTLGSTTGRVFGSVDSWEGVND
jgi:hypothetical protein